MGRDAVPTREEAMEEVAVASPTKTAPRKANMSKIFTIIRMTVRRDPMVHQRPRRLMRDGRRPMKPRAGNNTTLT